jgi:hypothetical protein
VASKADALEKPSRNWLAGLPLFGLSTAAILPSYVEWAVKVLAVVGAAAIGGLAVGFFVRRLGRWLTFREVPRRVLTLFRGLGAVAAGLAVWSMVFSPGGSGLFGGGGDVFGGKGSASGAGKQSVLAATSSSEPAASSAPASNLRPALRVVMLGGARVIGQRFYLIEGQKQPLTSSELQKVIKDEQRAGLRNLELLIYENSVARDHPAVRDLEKWAEQNDFTVTKLPTKGEMPN